VVLVATLVLIFYLMVPMIYMLLIGRRVERALPGPTQLLGVPPVRYVQKGCPSPVVAALRASPVPKD
jgi:hypothetical protein